MDADVRRRPAARCRNSTGTASRCRAVGRSRRGGAGAWPGAAVERAHAALGRRRGADAGARGAGGRPGRGGFVRRPATRGVGPVWLIWAGDGARRVIGHILQMIVILIYFKLK